MKIPLNSGPLFFMEEEMATKGSRQDRKPKKSTSGGDPENQYRRAQGGKGQSEGENSGQGKTFEGTGRPRIL